MGDVRKKEEREEGRKGEEFIYLGMLQERAAEWRSSRVNTGLLPNTRLKARELNRIERQACKV